MEIPTVRRTQPITTGQHFFNNPCPIAITTQMLKYWKLYKQVNCPTTNLDDCSPVPAAAPAQPAGRLSCGWRTPSCACAPASRTGQSSGRRRGTDPPTCPHHTDPAKELHALCVQTFWSNFITILVMQKRTRFLGNTYGNMQVSGSGSARKNSGSGSDLKSKWRQKYIYIFRCIKFDLIHHNFKQIPVYILFEMKIFL